MHGIGPQRRTTATAGNGEKVSNAKHGLSLFLVDAKSNGATRTRTKLIDSSNAARIELDNVRIPCAALLGAENEANAVLDQILDRGRICLAAEMLGGILEAFKRTVDYLT